MVSERGEQERKVKVGRESRWYRIKKVSGEKRGKEGKDKKLRGRIGG